MHVLVMLLLEQMVNIFIIIFGKLGGMDFLHKNWFSELSSMWPGVSLSLEIEEVLHSEKSAFQDILVLKTVSHGRVLILDGIIQCTEADEFSYQEMISFLPLCCHPCPKKVLIVGGGDGGVAREVTKYPTVESVVQVEIDERVIAVSKEHLPFMSVGLSHPKLTVHVGDGFKFMSEHIKEFDVIITDSSDPVGPAVSLFEQTYFSLMEKALRPGGIVCSQVGTIWSNFDHVIETLDCCRTSFDSTALAYAAVPTYPTGQIAFLLGSRDKEMNFKQPVNHLSEEQLNNMSLRYYTPDIHRSAFILPRFAEKAVKKNIKANNK